MNENKKKRGLLRHIVTALATLVIITVALTLFIYRDKLTSDGLKSLFGSRNEKAPLGEAYTYETGANELFASAGNGLAIVSSSGIQLLNDSGHTVVKQVFSLGSPAVSASASNCAFYDVGGTTLWVADFSGNVNNISISDSIISVSVNKNGWMAVVTEKTGYKAFITIYDAGLTPVYELHFGSAYVLSAQVSPDNKNVALLTAGSGGGGISIYPLSSKEVSASFSSPGELFIDISYINQNRICAISESRTMILDEKLSEKGSYDFGELYLTDYTLDGSGFAAVFLGKYRSGNAGKLVTIGQDGALLAETEVIRDLTSMSALGKRLLVCYSDELVLYSSELKQQGSYDDIIGTRGTILREKGDCLLLSSYSAEVFVF